MSNSDIRVVPGPANYFSHPGSLERLSDFLTPTSSRERCGSMASALWPAPNLFCRRPSTCRRRKRSALPATAANATWRGLVQASGDDAGGSDWRRRRRAARQRESAGPPPGGTAGGHPDYRRHLRGVDAAVGVV